VSSAVTTTGPPFTKACVLVKILREESCQDLSGMGGDFAGLNDGGVARCDDADQGVLG